MCMWINILRTWSFFFINVIKWFQNFTNHSSLLIIIFIRCLPMIYNTHARARTHTHIYIYMRNDQLIPIKVTPNLIQSWSSNINPQPHYFFFSMDEKSGLGVMFFAASMMNCPSHGLMFGPLFVGFCGCGKIMLLTIVVIIVLFFLGMSSSVISSILDNLWIYIIWLLLGNIIKSVSVGILLQLIGCGWISMGASKINNNRAGCMWGVWSEVLMENGLLVFPSSWAILQLI